jgi:hypothetical protein
MSANRRIKFNYQLMRGFGNDPYRALFKAIALTLGKKVHINHKYLY